jgi:hypothetical protein
VQPPAAPGPDPQGNRNQLDDGDDDEEASVAHMLPANLGDNDPDGDNPDDDDDDELLTNTEDSSDQSDADSMEDREAEQHDGGGDPIETAETDEGTIFKVPFIYKLISFGMTIPQALAIIKVGLQIPMYLQGCSQIQH